MQLNRAGDSSVEHQRIESAGQLARRSFRDLTTSAQLERILDLITRQGDILMTAIDDARAMIAAVAVEANQAADRITALIEASNSGADEAELRQLIAELEPVRDRLAAVTPDQPTGEPGPSPEPAEPGAPAGPEGQPTVPVDPNTGQPSVEPTPTEPAPEQPPPDPAVLNPGNVGPEGTDPSVIAPVAPDTNPTQPNG